MPLLRGSPGIGCMFGLLAWGIALDRAVVCLAQDKPAAEAIKSPAIPDFGDWVGRVLKVDRDRREITIDFGKNKGAVVGMRLIVVRTNPDPKAELAEREILVGKLDVVSVGEKTSIARPEKKDEAENFDDVFFNRPDKPDIRTGDLLENATDPEAFRVLTLGLGDDPNAVRELARLRVDLARKRLELARPLYLNGPITIERLIDASKGLMEAERDAAATDEEALSAIRTHLDRMNRLVESELLKHEAGNGSIVNVTEARFAQAEAAFKLAKARGARADGHRRREPADARPTLKPIETPKSGTPPRKETPAGVDQAATSRSLNDVAQKRMVVLTAFRLNGTTTPDHWIDAARALRDSELELATTREGQFTALASHLIRMTRIVEEEARPRLFLDATDFGAREARCEQVEAAWQLAKLRITKTDGNEREKR